MANLYLKAGGGNWSAAGTWSATSSAGLDSAGPPTAADNAILENGSGNVTIDAGAVCRSFDCTSGNGDYAGVITHTAGVTLTIGDGTAGAGNVALKFSSGSTYTLGNSTTSAIKMVSTSTTVQTLTANGKTLGTLTFDGVAGSWTLADTSVVNGQVGVANGSLNTNSQTCTWGRFSSNNSNTRSVTLGSSTITLTDGNQTVWSFLTTTGLTFSGASSTINMTGSTITFSPGSKTFGTVNITGGGVATVGAGTFTNVTLGGTGSQLTLTNTWNISGTFTINGSAGNNKLIRSSVANTARTIALGTTGSISASYVDVKDNFVTGTNTPVDNTTGVDSGFIIGWHINDVIQCYQGSVALGGVTTYGFSPLGKVRAGKTAVLMVGLGGGFSLSSVSDTSGNTWTVRATGSDGTRRATIADSQITTEIPTTGTITLTFSGSNNNSLNLWLEEVSHLSASPFDVSATGSGTGETETTSPTSNLAQASEIAFQIVRCNANSQTWTHTSPWSRVSTSQSSDGLSAAGYQITSSTTAISGATTSTPLTGVNIAWAMVVASYKTAGISPSASISPSSSASLSLSPSTSVSPSSSLSPSSSSSSSPSPSASLSPSSSISASISPSSSQSPSASLSPSSSLSPSEGLAQDRDSYEWGYSNLALLGAG